MLGPIDLTNTHGGRELSTYSEYPSEMQAAIKVKIMEHQQEVFDSWGEWIEFFEADQMKMNFLTLLQINDQIASAVSLDETECKEGYTL